MTCAYGLNIETDRYNYEAKSVCRIYGDAGAPNVSVSFEIIDSSNEIVVIEELTTDEEGKFSYDFEVTRYTNFGKYYVYAGYNGTSNSTVFEVGVYKPEVDIISPKNTTYNTTSINLVYREYEVNPSMCFYSINNKENITVDSNTTICANTGKNYLVLYCNDTNGKYGKDSVYFEVEQIPPSIKVFSPVNATYSNDWVYANITINESGTCTLYFDGKEMSMSNITNNFYLNITEIPEGKHKTVFKCRDIAGNENSTDVYLTTNYPPRLKVISPENQSHYSSEYIPLNYTLNEAFLDTCIYVLNGFVYNLTENTTIKVQRENTLNVSCIDTYKNMTSILLSFTSEYCGDNICQGNENCSTCEKDCNKCNGEPCDNDTECNSTYCVHGVCRSTRPYCGDGYCDAGEEETCQQDCEKKEHKVAAIGGYCGDNICQSNENCSTCEKDCGTCEEEIKKI